MTWVDAVFLVLVAVSGAIGYMRGLVREVLGVGAWVGAIFFAFYMLDGTRGLFAGLFPPNQAWMTDVAALAAVFVATLIILKILIALIARGVRNSLLGGVDRALGVVFGLGRGVVVILVAYIAAGAFVPNPELWPAPVREARSLPLIADGAVWLNRQLPAAYRPRLPDASTGRAPTAEELLRPPARNRI